MKRRQKTGPKLNAINIFQLLKTAIKKHYFNFIAPITAYKAAINIC